MTSSDFNPYDAPAAATIPLPQKTALDCPDAERAILGAYLLNPMAIVDKIAECDIALRNSWFCIGGHRSMHKAIVDVVEQVKDMEQGDVVVPVMQNLKEKGLLLESTDSICKGLKCSQGYIAELAHIGAVVVNIPAYLALMKRAWEARVFYKALDKARDCFSPAASDWNPDEPVEDRIARAQGIIFSASDFIHSNPVGAVKHVSDVVGNLVGNVMTCIENKAFDEWGGLDTGIPELNDAINGMRPGEVGIVAARPGCGKTALAIHMALISARRLQEKRNKVGNNKMPLFYFVSAEMMDASIAMRITGLATQTDTNFGRDGGARLYNLPATAEAQLDRLKAQMDLPDFDETSPLGLRVKADFEAKVKEVFRLRKKRDDILEGWKHLPKALEDLPIVIDDRSDLTIRDIRATASRLVRNGGEFSRGNTVIDGLGLIIVDYIQLVGGDPAKYGTNKNYNRTDEVGSVSKGLKNLAKELGVPIIALSQLNRDIDKRMGANKRGPQLSDIKDSGQIEQDADFILFLHEDAPDDKVQIPDGRKIINMTLAKNRHGPTGEWTIAFTPSQNRFHIIHKAAAKPAPENDGDNF